MWILVPHNDVSSALEEERIQSQRLELTLQKSFLLLPNADNVVGRLPKPSAPSSSSSSSCRPFRPISIVEQSISGNHASLTFDQPTSIDNPQNVSDVTLTDRSSYGTWVNGTKVHKTTQRLKDGDLVEFGGNRLVKFHLRRRPLVVTVSAISDAAKDALVSAVAKLGGHVISDWRRDVSTHCCMETIAVTIKTISAMVALKPVVTPAFFHAFLTAALKEVDASMAPPDEDDFLPEVSDSQLTGRSDVSFHVKSARAKVFSGKTFYFLDRKQYKKCFAVVEIGGGKTKLIEDGETARTSMMDFTRPDAIVMEPNLDRSSQAFGAEVKLALQKKNLRFVDTPEIGYAVIYASTRLFVNPAVKNPMEIWMKVGVEGVTASTSGVEVGASAEGVEAVPVARKNDVTSDVSAAKKQRLDESSSFNRKETRMDSLPSAATLSAAPAAERSSTISTSAARDVPPSNSDRDSSAVIPESADVPSAVPSQDHRSKSASDVGGRPKALSSSDSTAARDVAATAPVSVPNGVNSDSGQATNNGKTSIQKSSVLKRILWADSDEEEEEDAEEEQKKKKMKLEKEEELNRRREMEEKERKRKEEEDTERKRKVEQEKKQEEAKRDADRRKKHEEEEEKRRRRIEEEEKQRKQKEEEENRKKQKEDEDRRRKNEKKQREEEERLLELERQKKRRKSEDDFSDLDVDESIEEVEKKHQVSMKPSVNSINVDDTRGRNPTTDVDTPLPGVKTEPVTQLPERPNATDDDGWIRKPDKSLNRQSINLYDRLTDGDHLANRTASLSLAMMVEEVNLVVRRAMRTPKSDVVAGEDGSGDNSRKTPVKNFKRFKRSKRRNFHDVSRMVVDLVPVAMNAAPPDRFQPSLASHNRTGSTLANSSIDRTASSSASTLNGTDRSSVSKDVSSSRQSSSSSRAHPNFDVDFFDDEVEAPDQRPPQQQQPPAQQQQQPQQRRANQPADEFFDFDF